MLDPVLVGARITGLALRRRDMVVTQDDPPGGWSRCRADASRARSVRPSELLKGATVTRIDRRGKALAIVANSGRVVVVHLGMTGWLGPLNHSPGKHTHAVWRLEGGEKVAFEDPRRFGGLWCLPSEEALAERWSRLGPDALSVTARQLRERASGRKTAIKAALLDQSVLAGVGNIYADEALFRAGIDPGRSCCELPGDVWAPLARAIRAELRLGLKWGGATVRSYRRPDGTQGQRQNTLAVYGRAGHTCTRCGLALVSGQIAQRTTVWCPGCQKP